MKGLSRLNQQKIAPYLFISAPLLLVTVFITGPVIYAFYMSMFRWELLSDHRPFLGLGNYIDLLTDQKFLDAFVITLNFTFWYVLLSIVLGLVVALIVNNLSGKLQTFMKTVYFLPVITSMIAVSIIFQWLLRPGGVEGPINYYLSFVGLGPYGWLTDTKWALKSIIGVTLWKNLGFVMVIYLAGLLAIPISYYEAGRIDGANSWALFWHITLPLLRPTTLFLVITGIIGAFQVFSQAFILTQGGPAGSTMTLGMEIYFRAFRTFDMGSAAAISFVMFGVILIVTVIQFRYFGKRPEV